MAVVTVVAHATVAPAVAVAMIAVVMSNICAITVYFVILIVGRKVMLFFLK